MATTPQFVSTPNVDCTSFANADGTSAKSIFTPGSNGSRISAIVVTSDDTTARDIVIEIVQSSIAYALGQFTLTAGTTTYPITVNNALDPSMWPWLDPNDPHLILPAGTTLQARMAATITSGKKVDVTVMGGDF